MADGHRDIVLDGLLLRQEGELVYLRPEGDLSPKVAQQVVNVLLHVKRQHGRCFVLANLEKAGAIPPESRRLLIDHGTKHRPDAIALCSAGLLARTMNALVFGAMNLLGSRKQNTMQFATEQEGRLWIEAEKLCHKQTTI